MTRPRRRLPWVTLALVGVLLLIFACDFRSDEFHCEEAVAHMDSCCPNFNQQAVNCHFASGCGSTTYPSIDSNESVCLLAKSCEELRANGYCERVENAVPRTDRTEGNGADANGTQECP
jgi:hypothetical protein